jgi:4-hydroxythreonine-4-phosphate dehydrogenase
MGDPAGIGPEICIRALAAADLARICTPIVFGDAGVLRRVAQQLALPFSAPVLTKAAWPPARDWRCGGAVLDLQQIDAQDVVPGAIAACCGEAAYQYVLAAIAAGLAGEVEAVSTAPLNKEALHAADRNYPGHTEIFAERMQAGRSCMMLTSAEITCSLVTVHVGYHEVPGQLSIARILDVIELTDEALRRMHGRAPRLIACGLNPHAGENGLFGQREEERFIAPAVAAARAAGISIAGPLPPDTAFLPWRRRQTDAFVCMYHDQGLIPLKALAFDSAVNTTLGLPIVRTSVDHGTAFDIAWQGQASAQSLCAAIRLAAALSLKRPGPS